MVFERHNFNMNFSNASGMDTATAEQIILNEITDLVIGEKAAVIDVLQQAGVKVSPNASRREVVKLIAKHAPNHPKLKTTIAMMIADYNDPTPVSATNQKMRSGNSNTTGCPPGTTQNYFGQCIKNKRNQAAFSGPDDGYSNTTGCPPNYTQNYFGHCIKNKKGQTSAFSGEYDSFYGNMSGGGGGQLADALSNIGGGAAGGAATAGPPGALVGSIAGTLDSLFGFLKSGTDKKIAQEQTRQALINNLTAKENSRNLPAEGSGLSTGAKWGIGIAVFAVLGTATIVIIKMSR